ncbi:hypothetical protein LPJ63_004612 [Coemansia sp. RSA 2711]|nr:hypothetical protein LPJ63_004612 [Coemansia sp. RSA 2711]KAJ2329170.1 hypothetical protein IWW51_000764 [Coemansia sp. RSA 2702]KAJ2717426.1 hypothetical protein H4R23_005320 [Coemansia sp. Cherry 401B]
MGGVGVYFGHNNPSNYSGRISEPHMSSQEAELEAIRIALELLGTIEEHGGDRNVAIYSDSQGALDAIRRARLGAANCRAPRMQQTVRRIVWLLDACGYRVELRKVKAHAGIEGNEMADRLAKRGARGFWGLE